MQYLWTVGNDEIELMRLLVERLGGPPHPALFQRHGTAVETRPVLMSSLIAQGGSRMQRTGDGAAIVLSEADRDELIREIGGLASRLEHENNNMAFVPTEASPAADFWDIFAGTQALEASVMDLRPSP